MCLPHVHTSCPARLASHGISLDPALLPSILSALKILPHHRPINILLTMRATYLHSVQKDYSRTSPNVEFKLRIKPSALWTLGNQAPTSWAAFPSPGTSMFYSSLPASAFPLSLWVPSLYFEGTSWDSGFIFGGAGWTDSHVDLFSVHPAPWFCVLLAPLQPFLVCSGDSRS